jgi:all-trans-retinol dehydrogenase (NAD+)
VCPYYIDTGMFEGVKTRFAFLLPILKEEKAVDKILRAVERDRARLHMPLLVHSIPLLRLLPVSWFDAIARFMGISASMDEFVGRKADSS